MDSESFRGLPLAELVAHERHRRSLSLADVAALVRRAAEDEGRHSGATRQTAHNWERGQVPRPDSLRWLARALGVPTEKVADAAARQTAMKRRELLRGATLLAGGVLLPDHRSAPQTSSGLGDVMLAVTELDEVTSYLQRVFVEFSTADWLLGPRLLLDSVTKHLALVERLLMPATGHRRTDLLRVGARYAEFSSWLHQDVGDGRAALYWADRAMEWAHEARDPVIVSYVLARKADQAATEGDAARTVGLARAAQRWLSQLPARVQAVALLQEAHGLAIARKDAACHRKLDDACERASLSQQRGESGPGRYCTVEFVELQRATCSVELGHARRAIDLFEAGLARLPPVHRRDRGVYLSRMAVAHALDGEPEAASMGGLEAVQIARATGSRRITVELARLQRTLSPWRNHPAVNRLERAMSA
jgi:transcriptional regulator with XRE-family HTH domain